MARIIVQLDITTNEDVEEVQERVTAALEVARYRHVNSSAAEKSQWNANDDRVRREVLERFRERVALAIADQCEGASQSELYEAIRAVPVEE